MPLSDYSILNDVALMTNWFSGADLANIIKEVNFPNLFKIQQQYLTGFFNFQAGLACLTKDGLETCTTVKKEHFEEALACVKPSLSEEQIVW